MLAAGASALRFSRVAATGSEKKLSTDSSNDGGFELEGEIENLPDGSRVVRCGKKENGQIL